MTATLKGWLVLLLLGGTMVYAIAEEITLTTYYPSPRGVYNELHSNIYRDFADPEHFYVDPDALSVLNALKVSQLTLNGAAQMPLSATGSGRPVCSPETRGTLWFAHDVEVEHGTVDQLQVCAHVFSTYQWVTLTGSL